MFPFHYRTIDSLLIDELSETVLGGESIVLLGPRHVGKREVMRRMCALQEGAGVGLVVRLNLLSEPAINSEENLRELIQRTVADVHEVPPLGSNLTEHLLGPVDRLAARLKRPVTLYAANVDGIAYHLARSFLEGVRTRVEVGRLVAVLSGEEDFRDLVYGPNSEFSCSHQLVLQGYSLAEFHSALDHVVEKLQLGFASAADAVEHLWQLTGGNIHLARMILRALPEPGGPSAVEVLSNAAQLFEMLDLSNVDEYRRAAHVVSRAPSCWPTLEAFLGAERVALGPVESVPTPLELAGLATRDTEREGAWLRFASPLAQQFVRRYYDNRRLGDIYARAGMWEEAFERYSRLSPESRLRPSGIDDRADLELTVNVLCAALFAEAMKGVERVKQLFTRGCRYVLGLNEVYFWRHDGRSWRFEFQVGDDFDSGLVKQLYALLPPPVQPSFGLFPLDAHWDRFAVAALLPGGGEEVVAVVVGNISKKLSLSHERERLSKLLLHHFVVAYSHAVSVDLTLMRLNVRELHVETMNDIFGAMGDSVLDVHHVLQRGTRGLRRLGYRRVLLSLIDSEAQRIQGILDDSDEPLLDPARLIDLPLNEPAGELLAHVIKTREPYRVPDASREPRADPRLVREARLSAFALVPILNHAGTAIGTIHVERADGAVPSEAEIDDLLSFGRQLAVAVEQSERVNMLESALGKIPEPIVIVDRAQRRRYANRPAADLFHVREGWHDPRPPAGQGEGIPRPLAYLVKESLQAGQRLVTHVTGLGQHKDYRGAVLTDIILDWRQQIIAALLHVQDLNYFDRMIRATLLVAGAKDAESAKQSMLDAVKMLGHRWGQLYLLEEESGLLVSALSFGFEDDALEKRFEEGGVVLAPRDGNAAGTWLSIESRTPIVFRWEEELEPGTVYVTPRGLKAVNVTNPPQPEELGTRPGDFWIDFPLIAGDKVLGKLCLQCDEDLRPENFEMLKVLSEVAASLFESFLDRARTAGEREQMIKVSTAEKTLSIIAHNLVTRLGGLSPILGRYKLLESKFAELKPLNDDLGHIIRHTLLTVQRVKDRLGQLTIKRSTVDLTAIVMRTLSSALPEGAWHVNSATHPLEVSVDENMFGMALLEMVQNSKDALCGERDPRVNVSIEAVPEADKRGWVKLIYRDDGPGLLPELSETIFQEFFSYRPGQETGTGLGLAFVRRVVEAHGGVIHVGSLSGGAEFVIDLPKHHSDS